MKSRLILRWSLLSACAFTVLTQSAMAQEATRVQIRVTAKDAKILGSGVGGARITVRNAESGELLAKGVQEGSTGKTDQIMSTWERGAPIFAAEGAGGYVAELGLTEPTRVEIHAEGPLGTEHAIQSATKTLLLIPGRDVLGEGVIIELNGFTVELQQPSRGDNIDAEAPFEVRARVTMLCGCPTEPGGLWDSSAYEILVRAVRGSRVIGEWPMAFSGTTSEYTASATVAETGEFELQVIASDPGKGNFGMVKRTMVAR